MQCKQATISPEEQGKFGFGDTWTWVAIDADTRLVVSWLVGLRNAECATAFIQDLKRQISQ